MYQIIEATYQDGLFILDKKLHTELEGKRLSVVVFEKRYEEIEARRARFLNFVDQHQLALPSDYRFDREELHDHQCHV